jgi:hypothetical protein
MSDLCIHDMQRETCALCTPPPRGAAIPDSPVLISPQGKGHLDGCEHKGEEDRDYTRWGICTTPGAWRALVNGNPITADDGAVRGLRAESACRSCIERGLT